MQAVTKQAYADERKAFIITSFFIKSSVSSSVIHSSLLSHLDIFTKCTHDIPMIININILMFIHH
jgi:hypothetical protein